MPTNPCPGMWAEMLHYGDSFTGLGWSLNLRSGRDLEACFPPSSEHLYTDHMLGSHTVSFLWFEDARQCRPKSFISLSLSTAVRQQTDFISKWRGNPSISISRGMKKNELARNKMTSNLSKEDVREYNCKRLVFSWWWERSYSGWLSQQVGAAPFLQTNTGVNKCLLMCTESLCRKRMCSWQVQSCKGIVWTWW